MYDHEPRKVVEVSQVHAGVRWALQRFVYSPQDTFALAHTMRSMDEELLRACGFVLPDRRWEVLDMHFGDLVPTKVGMELH